MKLEEIKTTLTFYVNGKKIVDTSVDPEITLLAYLRKKLFLTGSKEGCSEGGCGACTVMLSWVDRQTETVKHISANACLTLAASVHGMSVTTVEGIGSIKKLHPVQERLAKAHGSQCGFCTPGFVMSMYTLLRNSPYPSIEEVEENLVGNLCRCTGYRPILEGFRTFCKPSSGSVGCGKKDCCQVTNGASAGNGYTNGSSTSASENGCGKSNCCQQRNGGSPEEKKFTQVLFDPQDFAPYSPTQDIIFPPELKTSKELDQQELHFKGPRVEFYRPISLQKVLALKSKYPEAKIVAGNTEIGVEVKYKGNTYPILIDISKIDELKKFKVEDDGINVGASLSMTKVEEHLKQAIATLKDFKVGPLKSILEMISLFAGKQIRNKGTFGGNIVTGSPISDLIPLIVSSGSSLKVSSADGERTYDMDDQFYTGYRHCKVKPNEVLISIKVPFTQKNEYFKWYKQSRRRDDDIAIVNSAFKVSFFKGSNVVDNISMAFGGMDKKVAVPLKTIATLKGQSWDDSLLEKASASLLSELELDPGAPGGMVDYRQTIVLSFFLKFHLFVRKMLNLDDPSVPVTPLTKAEDLELEPIKYQHLESMQFCHDIPPSQDTIDPVGRALPAVSNLKQATGEAEYIDDLPQLANQLAAAFVTSTIASGTIEDIDASEALKMNGVEAFFCAKDVPAPRNWVQADEEMFASKEVHVIGQVIGIVLAEDHDTAQRAARAVKVKYGEIKKPIITIQEAIDANSFYENPVCFTKGNAKEAIENSQHTLEGQFYVGGQEHFYLEPNAHLVVPKDGEHFEVYSPTQMPMASQIGVAKALDLPFHKVAVKVKRIGGSFGGKISKASNISATIAMASQKLKRPVRIVLDRWQDMQMTGGRHPMLGKWKVGIRSDGKVEGLDLKVYSNAGWSLDMSRAVFIKGFFMLPGPYNFDNRNLEGFCCKTNLPSNTAFRGFGVPQCAAIVEDMLERISVFVKRDPKQVKLLNMSPPSVPDNDTEHESTYITQCWEEAMHNSNYDARLREIKRFNSNSKTVKKGISVVPVSYGVGFDVIPPQQGAALVNVYLDGSVLLCHGGVEMGQGLQTKMLQVASRVLGIPIERIFTSESRTDDVPNGTVSAGSFSSDLYGMAVLDACQKIVDRLAPYRANILKGTWNDWIKAAYGDRVSLSATGFYKAMGINEISHDDSKGNPFSYRTNGVGVSEVEVDCLTGNFSVLRTDIVMDVGKSLNPGIDIGQIEGGFLQGMGWLTLEELKYSPNGKLLTLGPGMYKIPGVKDIPRSFNVSLLTNSTNTKAVYSSKGIGEPPLLLGTSVFCAIKEAIKDYRSSIGMDIDFRFDAPATAERIRMACQDSLARMIKSKPEGSYTPWSVSA